MRSEIEELKDMYVHLSDLIDTSDLSNLELAEKYFHAKNSYVKDIYTAKLLVYCWPALEKLYYGQNVKLLSLNDCYDIFLDSFLYVMDKCVWKNSNNSLYQDEDAILKAMYVLVESRRRNYFVAQNRQKRIVNQYPVSLDNLSEEFQEGYFSNKMETYNFERGWDKKYIRSLWDEKKYITALIFNAIFNLNVFDGDEISFKKIKKSIKHMSKRHYTKFLKKYGIIDIELYIYYRYVKNISDDVLYSYIQTVLNNSKNDDVLKRIKENYVN